VHASTLVYIPHPKPHLPYNLLTCAPHLVDDYPSLSWVVHADQEERPERLVPPLAPNVGGGLGSFDPLEVVPSVVDSESKRARPDDPSRDEAFERFY